MVFINQIRGQLALMGNGRRFGGISSSIGGIYKLGSLEGGERVMGNGGKPIIIDEYTACFFNE